MVKQRALIVALIFVAGISKFAHGDDQCIAAYGGEAIKSFLQQLQTAVAADDRKHVVAMVELPVTIMVEGRRTKLRRRTQLLQYYEVAFDPKVKAFIAKQKFSDLFCNWRGIMIGRGEIWINGIGEPSQLKIIAINNNPPWSPEDK